MTALDAAGVSYDRSAWTRPEAAVAPDPGGAAFYERGYAAYRAQLDLVRGAWGGPRP